MIFYAKNPMYKVHKLKTYHIEFNRKRGKPLIGKGLPLFRCIKLGKDNFLLSLLTIYTYN